MPTTDPVDKRMYANEVNRHEAKVRALAEHVHEYAGHLLREVETGRPSAMASSHVNTLASDVAELQKRLAALDALREVSFAFEDA